MTEVEFEGSRRSDTGWFSQSGDRIEMDFGEWNDRSAVLRSADTMVMDTVSGWTVTAIREDMGSTADGGAPDAAATCTDLTMCLGVRTERDNVHCEDRFKRALSNECDQGIACEIAISVGGDLSDFAQVTVDANQDGMFGLGGDCGVPSGALYVWQCSAVGEEASCRSLR